MNPLKERRTVTKTKAITTLFIGSALLVGFMATMSMPQMIGSVYAQSSQGSENACKELPGATLERGQCTAPATETETATCVPSTVGGRTAQLINDDTQCRATGTPSQISPGDCSAAGGSRAVNAGVATCTFAATITVTFTCPGDIDPTPEGQCITKPGDRTEEEV